MKINKGFKLILSLLAMSSIWAGTESNVGNGGDILLCPGKKAVVLDYWNGAIQKYGDVKFVGKTLRRKVYTTLERLEHWSPIWVERLKAHADLLINDVNLYRELKDTLSLSEINKKLHNLEIVDRDLVEIDDSGHASKCRGGKIIQGAVHFSRPRIFQKLFMIDIKAFEMLESNHLIGLILHEAIYRDVKLFSKHIDSNAVRDLNVILASNHIQNIDRDQYIEFISDKDYKFKQVDIILNTRNGLISVDLNKFVESQKQNQKYIKLEIMKEFLVYKDKHYSLYANKGEALLNVENNRIQSSRISKDKSKFPNFIDFSNSKESKIKLTLDKKFRLSKLELTGKLISFHMSGKTIRGVKDEIGYYTLNFNEGVLKNIDLNHESKKFIIDAGNYFITVKSEQNRRGNDGIYIKSYNPVSYDEFKFFPIGSGAHGVYTLENSNQKNIVLISYLKQVTFMKTGEVFPIVYSSRIYFKGQDKNIEKQSALMNKYQTCKRDELCLNSYSYTQIKTDLDEVNSKIEWNTADLTFTWVSSWSIDGKGNLESFDIKRSALFNPVYVNRGDIKKLKRLIPGMNKRFKPGLFLAKSWRIFLDQNGKFKQLKKLKRGK